MSVASARLKNASIYIFRYFFSLTAAVLLRAFGSIDPLWQRHGKIASLHLCGVLLAKFEPINIDDFPEFCAKMGWGKAPARRIAKIFLPEVCA